MEELSAGLNSGSRVQQGNVSDFLSEIVIYQGCYVMESALPKSIIPQPDQAFEPNEYIPDRSGYEYFENHLHTSGLFRDGTKGLHHLLMGVMLAEQLKNKLKLSYPEVTFRIIVSVNVIPFDNEDEDVMNDCVVRFYAVREGENILDEIEEYLYDAIGIIDI
jgi:hypothetical protein